MLLLVKGGYTTHSRAGWVISMCEQNGLGFCLEKGFAKFWIWYWRYYSQTLPPQDMNHILKDWLQLWVHNTFGGICIMLVWTICPSGICLANIYSNVGLLSMYHICSFVILGVTIASRQSICNLQRVINFHLVLICHGNQKHNSARSISAGYKRIPSIPLI